MLYQAINMLTACRQVATNKDFSIIVVTKSLSQILMDIYNYNTSSSQWQLKYSVYGYYYIFTNALAVSENSQTIILSFSPSGVSNLYYLNHY